MDWKVVISGYFLLFFSHIRCDPFEYSDCFGPRNGDTEHLFEYKVNGLAPNENYDFSSYQGKVMLAVNVASFWGYTPQYRYLNELQNKYGNREGNCSFQIFGFPSNQFGYQEPAENFELMNCLKYVRPGYGFVPAFPLAAKGDVNGINESPVFTFLKGRCPSPMGLIANRSDVTWTPIRNNDISWNFQKWLIRPDGQPYRRYTSRTTPQAIEEDINSILNECTSQLNGQDNKNNNTQTARQQQPPAQQQPAQQQPAQQQIAQQQPAQQQPAQQQPAQQPTKKRRSLFDLLW
jgi:glutathione peroxidase